VLKTIPSVWKRHREEGVDGKSSEESVRIPLPSRRMLGHGEVGHTGNGYEKEGPSPFALCVSVVALTLPS